MFPSSCGGIYLVILVPEYIFIYGEGNLPLDTVLFLIFIL